MSTPRLHERDSSASAELRAVMRHAKQQTPDAAQVAALIQSVSSQLPPAVAPKVPTGAAWSVAKLTSIAALISGLAVVSAYLLTEAPRHPEPAARTAPRAQPAQVARQSVEVGDSAVPTLPLPPAAREQPASTTATTVRKARAKPAERNLAAPDLESELTLLHSARRARKTQPEQALLLLREHEQHFPSSALSEERDALLIELLQRVAPAEAATRRRAFDARYPHSPYRVGLESPRKSESP